MGRIQNIPTAGPDAAGSRDCPGGTEAAGEADSVLRVFAGVASRFPAKVAVRFGDEKLTYRDLDRRSDALAAMLAEKGTGPGDLVGISSQRSAELIVAVMGALKAGAGYVPFDVALPQERLAFMAGDTGIRILLGNCPAVTDEAVEQIGFDVFPALGPSAPEVEVSGDSIAYVMFTSGTTGTPKGVSLPHRSVLRLLVDADWIDLGPDTVTLHSSAFAFDTSVIDIFGALLNGGTVVIPPDGLLSLSVLADSIRDHGVNTLWLTAGLFHAMADTHADAFANVRQLIVGGDIISPVQVGRVLDVCPDLAVINGYGPTESNVSNAYRITAEDVASGNPLPIGKSINGTDTWIVDGDLNRVGPGVQGELCIGGRGLALGYWNRPELTAEKFVTAPWDSGVRMYRSGDLAMDPGDGVIRFFGRQDTQIKIRGFRVELGEVETAIASFDGVKQAAAVALESAADGADKQIVGFYVSDAKLKKAALSEHVASRLPEYARPVRLMRLDTIPVTSNGKVDRRALAAVDGTAKGAAPVRKKPKAGKPGDISAREEIARITAEVLGIDDPDRRANFFDLGASSLHVARIHDGVEKALGLRFPITDFFLHTTIDTLAAHLGDSRQDAGPDTPVPLRRRGGSGDDLIAIVGMAGRFPGSPDVGAFWDNIVAGREGISHFSRDELDADPGKYDPEALYVAARGLIDSPDLFDARHFGIPPREAERLDPQHRVLMEVAQTALENAGHDPDRFGGRIGIFCGVSQNSYLLNNLVSAPGAARELAVGYPVRDLSTLFGNDKDFLATRIAYKLNLTGPAVNVQCACSTSLVAVAEACEALRSGNADMALAGGVAVTFPQKRPYLYTPDGMASSDGRCRAFDANATGTVFGDGAGIVVLRRLEEALEAGDEVIAVIRGFAINNDGSDKAGFAAPSIRAQADVIRDAHQAAGIEARQISMVEAHGTGTPLGDPIEFAALKDAFETSTADTGFCAIGSVKTNVGHLDTASGVTGLIKAALSLKNEMIPALVHYKAPNPRIDFESSPFYPVQENQAWPRGGDPRLAGVTSLGVGGTNIHMVLEEAPLALTAEVAAEPDGPQIFPLTASTPEALGQAVSDLGEWAEANPSAPVTGVLETLRGRRRLFDRRTVLVADGMQDLASVAGGWSGKGVSFRSRERIAFMFPGQGAQHVGMARELFDAEPVFREALSLCASLLEPELGRNVLDVIYAPEAQRDEMTTVLKDTSVAQPAIFSVSWALARQWEHWGVTPDALIGHSIGEFAAACIAGVMELPDALRLIAARGRLMGELPGGVMLSVRAAASELEPFLGSGMDLAAVNGAKACVIAGPEDAAERIGAELEAAGLVSSRLHTSHAFHSHMMDPAVDRFREQAAQVDFRPPSVPILSTVTGEWMSDDEACDPDYWAGHMRAPVRFYDGISRFWEDGRYMYLESGPGRTLSTLAGQNPDRKRAQPALASLPHAQSGESDSHRSMLESFGLLWANGLEVDWTRVSAPGAAAKPANLPTYPFQRKRFWVEPVDVVPGTVSESADPEPVVEATAEPASAIDAVREMLSELSGVPTDEMDGGASFLELGFDSLLLTQATKEIRDRFGVTVALRQLIDGFDTLDELAAHVEANGTLRGVVPSDRTPMAEMTRIEGEAEATAPAVPVLAVPSPTARSEAGDELTRDQRAHIDRLVARFNAKTPKSKELTAKYRRFHADPRTATGFNRLWKELVYQIVTVQSKGSRLIDIDGNEYVDILNGFGPGFLGHSPDMVVEAAHRQLDEGFEVGPQSLAAMESAQLFCEVTGNERASFVCTGSEAVYGAMRLARTVTGRDKIVVFSRDYHGNFDEVLVRSVQGRDGPRTMPQAPGVPRDSVRNVIVLPYGTPEALDYIRNHAEDLAAVLVEPVQSRRPEFQPLEFLREVRRITENAGSVLIFDEVVNGFRFGPRGAQGFFGIEADLVTYGKIPGGGMPIGVVAGKSRFMDTFDGGVWEYGDDSFPSAPVTFFAGTFVRHPLAMASARAMLAYLKQQPEFFWKSINARGDKLAGTVDRWFEDNDMPFQMPNCGSLMYLRIGAEQKFGPLIGAHMRDRGVFILEGFPSYLTAAHDDQDVDFVIDAIKDSALEMRADGMLTGREPVAYSGPKIDAVPPRLGLPGGKDAIALAMTRAPETIKAPTTDAQREIWANILVNPEVSAAYNESVSLKLRGAVDRDGLVAATRAVFERHDALKSVFSSDGLEMLVRAHCLGTVTVEDLSLLGTSERDGRLRGILRAEVEKPFDILAGPLVRAQLVILGPDECDLVVTAHHIVCDGWSIDVIVNDIAAVYAARTLGRGDEPAPAQSIIDYSRAEHDWRRSGEAREAQEYWLNEFAELPPLLDLPADHPRADERSVRGARLDFELPADLTGPLRQFGARNGATFVNLLMAAFNLNVARAAGLSDIVIGLPASGQAARGLETVVGHCVNLLPIRSKIDWSQGFTDYLAQLRGKLLDAFSHQEFAFGSLVRSLKLRRDPSRVTLVPVVFNIDNGIDLSAMDFGEVEARLVTNPRDYEHFELYLNVTDNGDRVLTEWSYCRDLFDPETIEAHFAGFVALLRSVLDNPDVPLSELDLPDVLPAGRSTTELPGAATPEDPDLLERYRVPLGEIFSEQVAARPDAPAIEAGGNVIDYRELDVRVSRVAGALLEAGIRAGDHVGISTQPSVASVVSILGCIRVGAAYVPLPDYFPPARLARIVSDAAITVVLGDVDGLDDAALRVLPAAEVMLKGDASALPQETGIDGNSVAYVMFTSGSTGEPKGVVIPHQAVTRLVQGQNFMELGPNERILLNSTLAFDASTLEVWGSLLNGGTLVIEDGGLSGPGDLGRVLEERRITSLWLTAGLFHALADISPAAFRPLRQLLTGGDVVSPAMVARVHEACPDLVIINGYGPTENTTFTCCHRISSADLESGKPLPVGMPVTGTDVYVLDSNLKPVRAGEAGELCAAGHGLAQGYLNREDLTGEKFISPRWRPELKLYRTGDLARRDSDGTVHYLGRTDNQVKLRGFRVEIGEVEEALQNCPGIRQAAVAAKVPEGQSDKVLVGYYVSDDEALAREAIASHVRSSVPSFAVPSHFVRLSEMPINANGKVDRHALPGVAAGDLSAGPLAEASTRTEERLTEIWRRALGTDGIGVDANFFEIGGHSLLAVRIFDRIRSGFGVELPISTLFRNQTIRELAAVIDEEQSIATAPVPDGGGIEHDPWDTTTVINPGPESGGGTPFFVVGGVGGNVNNLFEFGGILGKNRPVIGFQTRGVLGHEPRETIEEMAQEHISYMRRHQASGPYILAGYSGGTTIAFEMARQLVAQGELVDRLFVLDAYAPGRMFEGAAGLSIGEFLGNEWSLLRDEGLSFFFFRLRGRLRSLFLRGPVLELTRYFSISQYRWQKIEKAFYEAALKYRGGHYQGHASIIYTKPVTLTEKRAFDLDPWGGWRRFIDIDMLDKEIVPGDHISMVTGENAGCLAQLIELRIAGR